MHTNIATVFSDFLPDFSLRIKLSNTDETFFKRHHGQMSKLTIPSWIDTFYIYLSLYLQSALYVDRINEKMSSNTVYLQG